MRHDIINGFTSKLYNNKLFSRIILAMIVIYFPFCVSANNIQISGTSYNSANATVTFAITWDNSWRVSYGPKNNDAIWVFIKYKACSQSHWHHANLMPSSGSHSTASGSGLEVYIDGKDGVSAAKGAFIRRSIDGSGNINTSAITLALNGMPVGEFDYKVIGIEMAQIPEGKFYLGDGTSTYRLKTGATNTPYYVESEGQMSVGNSGSNLNAAAYVPTSPVPANYPKGFAEIYCMKYEVTQGQYTEFVNMLTSDKASARTNSGSSTKRCNITGDWPEMIATTPHRAMSYMSWADVCAFLDWTCLRPMTEFEFEKICRGTVTPVQGEYSWGNSKITEAITVGNNATDTEHITDALTTGWGLCHYNSVNNLSPGGTASGVGPLRVGFAATSISERIHAGATFYGVTEMSGNLHEQIVNSNAGSGFNGTLGDGVLTGPPKAGYSNQNTWPTQEGETSLSGDQGRGLTGGCYATTVADYLTVSSRVNMQHSDLSRHEHKGGRGVR